MLSNSNGGYAVDCRKKVKDKLPEVIDAVSISDMLRYPAINFFVPWRCISGLAQINWITRPFEDTGLELLDKRIVKLLIGLNYFTKSGIFIQIGGSECGYEFLKFISVFLWKD